MNRQKTIHGPEKPATLARGRAAVLCRCGRWFSLPACHAERHKSCSMACKEAASAESLKNRERNCETCGSAFTPRKFQIANGGGKFCSVRCSLAWVRTTEAYASSAEKRVEARRKSYVPKKGENHPRWAGGPKETVRKRIASGKIAAYAKRYRAENPDKAREWAHTRRGAIVGRLPYGSIPKLKGLQRSKCANCRKHLDKYHVDHIIPLALGGKHEIGNIQLLCPGCNLTKSAKDPIRFANEMGRLI